MIIVRHQQARRLHPLSAEEIGIIVKEVTAAVVKVMQEQPAPAMPEPPRSLALGRPRQPPRDTACPRLQAVFDAACQATGIDPADMMGPRRSRKIAWPRQVAMLACADLARHASLPQIGRVFRRDHTTIMHGIAKARARVEVSAADRATYEAIKALATGAVRAENQAA